jgi:hypothetical protein
MPGRAGNDHWDAVELALLEQALAQYEPRKVNYKEIATRFFRHRSVVEVRKRCIVIRDRARRLERWREMERWRKLRAEDTQALLEAAAVCTSMLPHDGKLHPEVVWVPTEFADLETLF